LEVGTIVKNFVDLDQVTLRYGEDGEGTLALKNLSFQVDQSEFVAVVGPSGCGKSTLMKVVTGLWPPTRGHRRRPQSESPAQYHRHGIPKSNAAAVAHNPVEYHASA
jgi:ABC-type nitrate/sulfonate/bicarbonate transport system ATPase subunit